MNKSKVLLTGVTGQDGSLMTKYLLKNTDCQIIGAVRRTSQEILSNIKEEIKNPRFKLAILDLTDSQSILTLIKNERPDYLINLAASSFVADSWIQPALTMEANAISVIHMLEAIRHFCPVCRFYSAGSSEQWGDVAYSPQDEKHPMRPRSIYGVSKCAAGLSVKVYRESYNLYAVHGILTNHEGSFRQKHFVTRKITNKVAEIREAIRRGGGFSPLELGNVNAERDWSDARDFVDGIWRMLNQEKFNPELNMKFSQILHEDEATKIAFLSKNIKEYVLSSNETHSIREFVERSFAHAGVVGEWNGEGLHEKFSIKNGKDVDLVIINPEFYRPAEVSHLHGNSNLIRHELGWSPQYSFDDLVRSMVENDLNLIKNG